MEGSFTLGTTGKAGDRGGPAQTLQVQHAAQQESDDVISARDTAVWVGGIPKDLGEDGVREMLERFGAVTAISMREKDDGVSRGHLSTQAACRCLRFEPDL